MISDLALIVGLYCTWRVAEALLAELSPLPRTARLVVLSVLLAALVVLTIDIALAGSGWAQSELGQ